MWSLGVSASGSRRDSLHSNDSVHAGFSHRMASGGVFICSSASFHFALREFRSRRLIDWPTPPALIVGEVRTVIPSPHDSLEMILGPQTSHSPSSTTSTVIIIGPVVPRNQYQLPKQNSEEYGTVKLPTQRLFRGKLR